MRSQARNRTVMYLLVGCLWLAAQPASATTATWTNIVAGTTVVDTWANASNWNAAQYPGQDAANQNAYLTNRVANAVYKAVVDASLPNQVGTVEIKNLGAGGEAWVIVTNSVLIETNLLIRTGGRLQIDNQGVVTNAPGFAYGQSFTMDGTNGLLLINSGGSLFASTNSVVGLNGGGKSNVLSLGEGALLSIINGNLSLGSGAGSSFNQLIVTNNNVRFRTTVAPSIGGSTLNEALFTGTGTVWDCSSQRFYFGSGGVSNLMTISQGSLWLTNCVGHWVGYSTGNGYNRMVVTNGARLYSQGGLAIGYNGVGGNTFTVTGSGSLWDGNGGSARAGDGGGLNNVLLVDQAGMVSNASVIVGNAAPASGNSLVLTNGAKWWGGTASGVSTVGNACTNNSMVVTGQGALWDLNARSLTVGTGAAGIGNVLRILNSALVTNVNGLTTGAAGASRNTLIVAGGGRCALSNGGSYAVGSGGASSNFTLVSGSGSMLSCAGNLTNGNIFVGSNGATGNVMVVENSSSCPGWAQLYMGRFGGTDNKLIITNKGYLQVGHVRVSHQGSNTWNNLLLIVDGGILEVGSSGLQVDQATTGPVGNNCITNNGGIYQFYTASPTITPMPANNSFISLTDGTISFRGVTAADVKGNRSGNLTNIQFNGNNAFRLNSATNTTSPDQSYTFTDTLGPANYARLELYNGSMYRGGSVTIGSGGTLAISGTPSTITNLTIASGGALEVTVSGTNSASPLNAVGSVTLGGALRLILAAPPPPAGFDWTLINKSGAVGMTGQFEGGSTFKQAYLGTNYTFRITTAGGDGNDLVLSSMGKSMTGTTLLVY